MEIVNLSNIKAEDITSYLHKVRVMVFNPNNELFITDMNGSYNLPGGRVENNEDIKTALKRELNEELGISITIDEPIYIGNYHFYHDGFPEKGTTVLRDNEIDLFLIADPKVYHRTKTNITDYEKSQNFVIKFASLENISQLLQEKNSNKYKKFTDIELKFLIDKFIEYRKGNIYVR